MADISVLNFGDGVNRNIKDVTSRVLLPSTVGWTGKNELPHKNLSSTASGITITTNANGSYTLNGRLSADYTTFKIALPSDYGNFLANGTYILNGAPNITGCILRAYNTDGNAQSKNDTGNGVEFNFVSDSDYMFLIVLEGNNVLFDNVVFWPMIRDSRITDPTYEPYHKSVEECLDEINDKLSYLETTATLSTSAATTVTFTSAKLTTSSCVEVGVSEWGLVPDDVTVSTGSCTVTLPKVDSAHTVTVRLYVR